MKFHSQPIEEHDEVPLADHGQLEQIVSNWTRPRVGSPDSSNPGHRCYLLSIQRPHDPGDAGSQLAELRGLVEAQGDSVCGEEAYLLTSPDPRTLLRSGVADRIGGAARACGAEMLVIDAEISPSQARNLEHATGLPIFDREAVILNVFERHATTRRARVQVEIAHLEYLRPRIRGIGLNMDQQAGGVVGSRGPGETASELFARRLDGRLADLRRTLGQLARSQATERHKRGNCARIALIGYTNAGKTSLMNALTSAGLSARDRPFETLDTTSRCLTRHGGDILLSDTVGFIRRLPERLLASFESTLAELCEASLLVWVLDSSDPELETHIAITEQLLARLGASEIPRLVVFNKLDLCVSPPQRNQLSELVSGHPFVSLSARDAAAVSELRERMLEFARSDHKEREVFVPYGHGAIVQQIYRSCRVRCTRATPHGTQFVIAGPKRTVDQIARSTRKRQR